MSAEAHMLLRHRSVRSLVAAAIVGVLLAVGLAPIAQARGGFPDTIPLPAGLRPEGITSGPGTTFYVGSLADGRIYRGDLRTGEGDVLVPGAPDASAAGLFYERRAGRLWIAGAGSGTVTVVDAGTGEQLGRWEVEGAGFLNDLVVTRDAVYVTDSVNPHLVVLPLGRHGDLPDEGDVELLPLTGDIVYTEGFNANGIRALRGGRDLVVVQGNVAKLFNVDAETGVADEIEVTGGTLTGGDGLVLRGNRLYVVRGTNAQRPDGTTEDAVAVLRLVDRGRSAVVVDRITDPDLDTPSTATIAAGRLWAVNARFASVPTPTPETPYDVVQLPLRSR